MLDFLAAQWRKRTVCAIIFFSVHMRTAQRTLELSSQESLVESCYAGKLGRLVSPSLNRDNLIIEMKKETGGPVSQEDIRYPFCITGDISLIILLGIWSSELILDLLLVLPFLPLTQGHRKNSVLLSYIMC